ncbi:MAG: hypothetical protein ACTSYI_17350 [Promethearchaeota archaeon]
MKFITDTCFWSHVKVLTHKTPMDIRPVFHKISWGITKEIASELNYFSLTQDIPLEEAIIFPVPRKELEKFARKYEIKHLDKADQEILFVSKHQNTILLTDDGELFLESTSLKLDTLRLPGFILLLVSASYLSKNQALKCFNYWEKAGSYKKRELSKYKMKLQKIC